MATTLNLSNRPANRWTIILLAASILPVVVVFWFVDAYPQPAGYYQFADSRTFFGVPNFLDVASNALFLVFGLSGLRHVLIQNDLNILQPLKAAYVVLFVGITLTAFGSGWFHLAPSNDTLFWDRLPMTVAFMPLFAIILGEHVSESLARNLFWPLLFIGIGSVIYWDYSESLGEGDLRLYGLVQFLPMLLIPIILYAYRSAFDTTRFFWVAIGLYALAKILEQLDLQLFSLGELISGHSLKHIAASIVPLVLLLGFKNRGLRDHNHKNR